jgi:hypothetical protein
MATARSSGSMKGKKKARKNNSSGTCEFYCSSGDKWKLTHGNASSGYYCPSEYGRFHGCPSGSYTLVSAFPNPPRAKPPAVPRNKGEYTMVRKTLYLNRTNADSKHFCPPILRLRAIAGIDKKASDLLNAIGRKSSVSSINIFLNAIRLRDPISTGTSRKRHAPSRRPIHRSKS